MKILADYWFSTMSGLTGIVIGTNEITGKPTAFIGTASGLDQVSDAEHIAKTGAKIPLATLDEIRGNLANQVENMPKSMPL